MNAEWVDCVKHRISISTDFFSHFTKLLLKKNYIVCTNIVCTYIRKYISFSWIQAADSHEIYQQVFSPTAYVE